MSLIYFKYIRLICSQCGVGGATPGRGGGLGGGLGGALGPLGASVTPGRAGIFASSSAVIFSARVCVGQGLEWGKRVGQGVEWGEDESGARMRVSA